VSDLGGGAAGLCRRADSGAARRGQAPGKRRDGGGEA
jgi:hypothetical protein